MSSSGRPLRRAPGEVAAAGRDERHAEVEQDARAVVGGDLDAHAADLVLAAMDRVLHELLSGGCFRSPSMTPSRLSKP